MKVILIHLFLLLAIAGYSQPVSPPDQPIHQLRIYEIFKDNKQAFHERFRDHASQIMKNYGFKIVAIWEAEKADRTEFVYILEWENENAMKESWAKFMADQEWKDIKKKTSELHGQLVGEIEDRVLVLQDYSPSKTLLKKNN
jgi:heme-degrading monooxygenase HmoA